MRKRARKSNPMILVSNHMDAWGVTFIIGSVYLLIHDTFDLKSISLLVTITLGYWFGFAVNDFFDVELDSNSPDKARRNFFVQYSISRQMAFGAAISIVFVLLLGFLGYGVRGTSIFILSIFMVWTYSAPPLRLKSRPIFDLLSHAIFVQTFPYLTCLLLIETEILLIDYWLLAFFFFGSLSAQLEQQTRDYDLDRQYDNNFTLQFGKQTSLVLQKILTVTLIFIGVSSLALGVLPMSLIPVGLLGLPLLFHRLLRGNDNTRSEFLIRVSLVLVIGYIALLWVATILQ